MTEILKTWIVLLSIVNLTAIFLLSVDTLISIFNQWGIK